MLARVDVDLVLDRGDAGRGDGLGSDPQGIGPARDHRFLVHPDHVSGELIGDFGPFRRLCQNVAAADVDLVLERDGHGIANFGKREIAIIGRDPLDVGVAPRSRHHDFIADRDAAGSDRSRIAAEVQVRTVHPLHREAEGQAGRLGCDIDALEIVHQAGAVIPVGIAGAVDDVVAVSRRDRDRHDRGEVEARGEGDIVADDPVKDLLAVIDEVDLVHGHHDVPDAEQRANEGVTLGLHQHALAGVDQDDGELGVGSAGRHVAGILFVAGGVGDHEGAARRVEEAVGDVDGDALFALGLESVHQQRKIDIVAGGAVLDAVARQRLQLILIDHLAVVQEPADQRRFSVVDRAAGDEAQLILALGSCRTLAWHPYPSEIAFPLLFLHRRRFVAVDEPSLALRYRRNLHFRDDLLDRGRAGLDGAAQRIASERAETDRLHFGLFVRLQREAARRRP